MCFAFRFLTLCCNCTVSTKSTTWWCVKVFPFKGNPHQGSLGVRRIGNDPYSLGLIVPDTGASSPRTHRKFTLCRLQIFLKVNIFRTRQILLWGFCLYVVSITMKAPKLLSEVNVFKNHFILLNEYNNYVPLLHAHLVLSGKKLTEIPSKYLKPILTRYTRSMQAASWQLLVVSIPFMFHWQPFLKSLGRFFMFVLALNVGAGRSHKECQPLKAFARASGSWVDNNICFITPFTPCLQIFTMYHEWIIQKPVWMKAYLSLQGTYHAKYPVMACKWSWHLQSTNQ